jgi:hypothetical protein
MSNELIDCAEVKVIIFMCFVLFFLVARKLSIIGIVKWLCGNICFAHLVDDDDDLTYHHLSFHIISSITLHNILYSNHKQVISKERFMKEVSPLPYVLDISLAIQVAITASDELQARK